MSKLEDAVKSAEGYVARFGQETVGHIIDGKPDLGNGQTFDVHSPIDDRLLAKGVTKRFQSAAQLTKALKKCMKAH